MKNAVRMAALGLAVLVGSSFAVAQDWDNERDDYRYDRAYGYNHFEDGRRVAHQIGYQDGVQVAREDQWHGKPFNPYPRGHYRWADHGYRRGFGDKNEYRSWYADGYGDGYKAASRGNRGYDNRGYDRDDYRWRR